MAHAPHNVIHLPTRRTPASRPQAVGSHQLDLWPTPQPTPGQAPGQAPGPTPIQIPAQPPAPPSALRPPPVLRVTRIIDSDQPHATPGPRLRITGRLQDVCAELDRLAAAEARAA